jgi:ubiquinone biosynthesis protein Coq4
MGNGVANIWTFHRLPNMTLGQLIIETIGALAMDPESSLRHLVVNALMKYQLISYRESQAIKQGERK